MHVQVFCRHDTGLAHVQVASQQQYQASDLNRRPAIFSTHVMMIFQPSTATLQSKSHLVSVDPCRHDNRAAHVRIASQQQYQASTAASNNPDEILSFGAYPYSNSSFQPHASLTANSNGTLAVKAGAVQLLPAGGSASVGSGIVRLPAQSCDFRGKTVIPLAEFAQFVVPLGSCCLSTCVHGIEFHASVWLRTMGAVRLMQCSHKANLPCFYTDVDRKHMGVMGQPLSPQPCSVITKEP